MQKGAPFMFSFLTFSFSALSKTCGPLIVLMECRKILPSGLIVFFVYMYLDFCVVFQCAEIITDLAIIPIFSV